MERRITPSLIVSVIALVVALGGASYAAIQIPKNSVGTKQIKNRAVNSNKVKDGSLLLKDFKSGQVKPNAWEGSKDATPTPISSTARSTRNVPGSPARSRRTSPTYRASQAIGLRVCGSSSGRALR